MKEKLENYENDLCTVHIGQKYYYNMGGTNPAPNALSRSLPSSITNNRANFPDTKVKHKSTKTHLIYGEKVE